MFKIVSCLRRSPTRSTAEFREYWLNRHAELVAEHAPALGKRRYTQSHTVDDPRLRPALEARGSEMEPFDGVAEVWWESVGAILRVGATKEGRAAGRALLEDEARFIDLPRSAIFYADEHVIFE